MLHFLAGGSYEFAEKGSGGQLGIRREGPEFVDVCVAVLLGEEKRWHEG